MYPYLGKSQSNSVIIRFPACSTNRFFTATTTHSRLRAAKLLFSRTLCVRLLFVAWSTIARIVGYGDTSIGTTFLSNTLSALAMHDIFFAFYVTILTEVTFLAIARQKIFLPHPLNSRERRSNHDRNWDHAV